MHLVAVKNKQIFYFHIEYFSSNHLDLPLIVLNYCISISGPFPIIPKSISSNVHPHRRGVRSISTIFKMHLNIIQSVCWIKSLIQGSSNQFYSTYCFQNFPDSILIPLFYWFKIEEQLLSMSIDSKLPQLRCIQKIKAFIFYIAGQSSSIWV